MRPGSEQNEEEILPPRPSRSADTSAQIGVRITESEGLAMTKDDGGGKLLAICQVSPWHEGHISPFCSGFLHGVTRWLPLPQAKPFFLK